jgi:hypothetical protein
MATSAELFRIRNMKDYRSPGDKNPKYKLEIPSYQRGIVWPKEKKASLIRSIAEGFPIGALMMYVKEVLPNGKTTVLQVIDGLQRSTAVLEYAKSPLALAPVTSLWIRREVFASIQELLADHGFTLEVSKLIQLTQDWAEDAGTPSQLNGFTANDLAFVYAKSLGLEEFSFALRSHLVPILKEHVIEVIEVKLQELDDYEIPVILYSGPESDLPDIFEKLNSGTPLTKYDKFHATWSEKYAIVENDEIRDFVKSRYKLLVDQDWEIAGFDPNADLGTKDLNLFEYLTGLGHLLSDSFPYLFAEAKIDKEAPSIGFALATLAMGLRLNDMDKLPEAFPVDGEYLNPSRFESALKDICSIINDRLSKFLSLKLNSGKNSGRFLPHSELQVISIICRALVEKYDTATWLPKPGSNQLYVLLESMTVHYVLDILRDVWKGSGDSNAYGRIWSENHNGDLVKSAHYVQKPELSEVKSVLNEYHVNELRKNQTERPSVSMKTKLLLRVLYADIVTHSSNLSDDFHIEHIYPVKALADFILANPGIDGLPISAFGNLAILTKNDNIIKGKNFIGDYLVRNASKVSDVDKIQAYIISPDIHSVTLKSFDSAESYRDFCTARFAVQLSKITKFLGF